MTKNCHVRFGERSRETRSSRGEKVRSAPTLSSPLLANIYLHRFDEWYFNHYGQPDRQVNGAGWAAWQRARKKGKGQAATQLFRYADDVRHLTRCLIPLGERRSSEEMTSGSLSLPGGESQRGN